MHLLYLDDSGSTGNQDEDYLVLGGLSIFEAQAYWLTQQLDTLAESIDPQNPQGVEFHASEIFARRVHPWKSMTREEAQGVIFSVLKILSKSYDSAVTFACAIHKNSFPTSDPILLAFEDLCSRFDIYLSSMRDAGDRQRGLIILDKSAQETTLQQIARDFRTQGTRWGSSINNLADTPLFVDSKASRLIQLADHVAYATFRRYQAADTKYFDIVAPKFYCGDDGVVHGLAHKDLQTPNCMCPACLSRR